MDRGLSPRLRSALNHASTCLGMAVVRLSWHRFGHFFIQQIPVQFGLKPPTPHSRHAVPNITLHRKTSNRRILNLEELVAMLRTLGHVREAAWFKGGESR